MTNLNECVVGERLANIPEIDGCSFETVPSPSSDGGKGAYLVSVDADGSKKVVAYLDGEEGAAYRCSRSAEDQNLPPVSPDDEPLVMTVGSFDGETGQIVIKQPEGHWRRYSRWDRIEKAPPGQPSAVVRTLPQCGCGGYLGAPMMFDSFEEMLAYFFVVFSDAESVNAKHAAILNGDSCTI